MVVCGATGATVGKLNSRSITWRLNNPLFFARRRKSLSFFARRRILSFSLLVTLRLQISDVLFSFLRNSSEDEALDRHQHISSAITIMHDICANTAVLGAWNYSLEHQNFVLNRFRTLSGWRRRLQKNIILTPALPLVWMGDTTPRQQQHQQNRQQEQQQNQQQNQQQLQQLK